MPKQTESVAVTFTLDSTIAGPPYYVANCAGTITYSDGSTSSWNGWNAEDLGTPDPNGADFSVSVMDSAYSATNQASMQNWALTFIPRGTTAQASPFGNNQNTLTGGGPSNQSGTFQLGLGNVKIKNAGDWDWALMVQMVTPSGQIRCFASDPEMEVGA